VGKKHSAHFFFEIFYRFFRNFLASGNMPLEQIRNRLVDRSKYLLPTSADGSIIPFSRQFQIELKLLKLRTVVEKLFKNLPTEKVQKNVFPNFILTNK
jgi:hypothetical protein